MPITRDIDQILATVFAALAALYLLRAGLGIGLYAAGAIPGRVGSRCRILSARITPQLLRRVGSALLSASAVGGSVGGLAGVTPAAGIGLDRGPTTSNAPHVRAGQPAPRSRPPAAPTVTDRDRTVVVQPGDCLWTIAARRLPPGASAADIDLAWRRWYERNHTQIGPDPDLILTGSRLLAPR